MSTEYKQFLMKKYSFRFLEKNESNFVDLFPFCFCFWGILCGALIDQYIYENTQVSKGPDLK